MKTNRATARLVKEHFGLLLRKARERKGLSRSSFCSMVGVSVHAVESWEGGRTFIADLSIMPRIEQVLGVKVGDMLTESLSLARGG